MSFRDTFFSKLDSSLLVVALPVAPSNAKSSSTSILDAAASRLSASAAVEPAITPSAPAPSASARTLPATTSSSPALKRPLNGLTATAAAVNAPTPTIAVAVLLCSTQSPISSKMSALAFKDKVNAINIVL